MKHLKVIDAYTHMTPLMGFVAAIAAHARQSAVRVDRYLVDGAETYSGASVPSACGLAVAAGVEEAVFSESLRYRTFAGVFKLQYYAAAGYYVLSWSEARSLELD